jgi:hypothetical protein
MPGISAATFRGRRFFLAASGGEARQGRLISLFPLPVVIWVAIVVEDLLLLCRVLDPVLVFVVLLLLLLRLFALLRVQSQFLYRLQHHRYNRRYNRRYNHLFKHQHR